MKPNFTAGNILLRKAQSEGNIKPQHWQKSQELKDLEKLSLEVKRLRFPNNPYLVADTFEDKTANGLTKAIIEFLRLSGHQAERISTTGRPIDSRQTFVDVTGRSRTIGSLTWIPGTGTNGSADIHCCINGRAVRIEVKIGSDRQSAAQKKYEKQVVTSFGIYYVARTFETFVKWYEQRF